MHRDVCGRRGSQPEERPRAVWRAVSLPYRIGIEPLWEWVHLRAVTMLRLQRLRAGVRRNPVLAGRLASATAVPAVAPGPQCWRRLRGVQVLRPGTAPPRSPAP